MPPPARTAALVAGLLAGLVAAAAPAGAAPTASPRYTALGDSYSSGAGTRSYLADGTSCLRSAYGFPSLLASSRGWSLDLQACSGATTLDVAAQQLGGLSRSTAYVTVTAGGNDAGFRDTLTTCAEPAWLGDCGPAVDRAQAFVRTQLPGRLAQLYAAVRARAPRARVVVVGYPRIFQGEDCNALTWFSPSEQTRLNTTADLVDAQLATAAAAAGFAYRDPRAAFTGHAVCDHDAWLNGLTLPLTDSYHPDRSGYALGFAPLVGAGLTGSPGTVTAVRPDAAPDRPGAADPEGVAVPDLTTPRARAAAARAGVDLTSRASIDGADRRWTAAQATGAASPR